MKKSALIAVCVATGMLGACSSLHDFMDSSHGPNGTSNTINTRQSASNVQQAKAVSSGSAAPAAAKTQTQSTSSSVQAGVVKPYSAYEQEAQSVENQLLNSPQPETSSPAVLTQSHGEQVTPALEDATSAAKTVTEPRKPQVIDITTRSSNTAVSALTSEISMSGHCNGELNSKVQNYAQDLALALSSKLQVDHGEIFVAPTVIPDEYQDCVSDAQQSIKEAFAQTSNFKPSTISDATIYQNAGSSTVIPRLVRACRAKGVPYLCYTTLGTRGNKLRITMRLIRISDGITLTQDYKNLE